MTNPTISPEVEEMVGAWVGIVAVLHIQGVNEMTADGCIAAETRQIAGKVLTRLSMLRLDGFPSDSLKHAAFLHAPDTIKSCCATLNDTQINELIDKVLGILDRSIKQHAH